MLIKPKKINITFRHDKALDKLLKHVESNTPFSEAGVVSCCLKRYKREKDVVSFDKLESDYRGKIVKKVRILESLAPETDQEIRNAIAYYLGKMTFLPVTPDIPECDKKYEEYVNSQKK